MTEPMPSRSSPRPMPAPGPRRPSATRSASSRRRRLIQEAGKGNTNALKSGIHADVLNTTAVADEIAVTFATHPHLDSIADYRLVEQYSLATVRYARACIAIEADGWSATLIAAARDFGNRAERLERAVHQRERERIADHTRSVVDLSAFKPRQVGPGDAA